MKSNTIKNVIFDVGNVIVRWSPVEIIRLTFGAAVHSEALAKSVFQSELWVALNKGQFSESEAQIKFQTKFGFSPESTEQLFYYVKHSQLLLFGTVALIKRLKAAGYRVYALTDNVVEIVDYLKSNYDFWPLFDGATVSAEVGYLKPHPEIFNHLRTQQHITAEESVFIDDMQHNVQGAESLGFAGIQFENALQCEHELKQLGLSF